MGEEGWEKEESYAKHYRISAPFSHENYSCLYFPNFHSFPDFT